jgi:hypothetical protein
MSTPTTVVNHAPQAQLTAEEERLVQVLRLLRQLAPRSQEEVEQFVWSLVGRYLKWSYDDPESMARAAQFMALDPYLRRESAAIGADFAPAMLDGLEDY